MLLRNGQLISSGERSKPRSRGIRRKAGSTERVEAFFTTLEGWEWSLAFPTGLHDGIDPIEF